MELTEKQQKNLDALRKLYDDNEAPRRPDRAIGVLLDIIATLQAAEPPVTDATFAVGDRVRDIYTEEVGTVKSIARNEQWQECDLFSPHWFTVDFDKSGTKSIGGNYIKADDAVTDERATDTPWQVRHRVDLMAFAYEVYKPDENYVINRVACSSTPIYLCGCGRYDCEHVDAVKAYIEAQAASTHSGFKWDGHNWEPIAPKAASDGAE